MQLILELIYMNEVTIYSKDTLMAYAGFLLSEKNRHLEDIKNINEKLSLLESKGIHVDVEGPWIKEEVLQAQPIHR
jgi:hypothetical protein